MPVIALLFNFTAVMLISPFKIVQQYQITSCSYLLHNLHSEILDF